MKRPKYEWRLFLAGDLKTHDECLAALSALIDDIVTLTGQLERYESEGTTPPNAAPEWPRRARSFLSRLKMIRADVERQAGIMKQRERDDAIRFRRAAERLLPSALLEMINEEVAV